MFEPEVWFKMIFLFNTCQIFRFQSLTPVIFWVPPDPEDCIVTCKQSYAGFLHPEVGCVSGMMVEAGYETQKIPMQLHTLIVRLGNHPKNLLICGRSYVMSIYDRDGFQNAIT